MSGRTTFIVAHRLDTLRHCDVIYAVDGGRLVPASAEASRSLMANRGLAQVASATRPLQSVA
jgi:ABC-type multidrug transport system fused ATPase/permease subunit